MSVITKITYISDGSTRNYAVPFEYLSQSHVHIYLGDTEITSFTWLTTYSIQLTTAPAVGTLITIKRTTPFDVQYVVWQDGSVIQSDDMNSADLQTLFVLQENMDELVYLLGRLNEFDEAIAEIQRLATELEARIDQKIIAHEARITQQLAENQAIMDEKVDTAELYKNQSCACADMSKEWYEKLEDIGLGQENPIFVYSGLVDGQSSSDTMEYIYDGGTSSSFLNINNIIEGMDSFRPDWFIVNPDLADALRGRSIVSATLQSTGNVIFSTD